MTDDERARAEAIRRACVELLLEAYEDGGLAGLCHEGRFELAVDRLRAAPIEALLAPE
ncbi:MAG: hypothetical protein IT378_23580 [Sandaracinaceae bacterium]|nr:hypothetical protein [Sandaracinaceae bacterium]